MDNMQSFIISLISFKKCHFCLIYFFSQ